MSGLEFNENTWTKRLVGSLKRHLPRHDVKHTAEDATNFKTVQARYSLLGTSSDIINCYIFHGCTDIRIGKNIMVEVDASQDDSQGDPPSSGDEANIEVSKKADPQELPFLASAV